MAFSIMISEDRLASGAGGDPLMAFRCAFSRSSVMGLSALAGGAAVRSGQRAPSRNSSQPDWLRVTPLHHFARKGDVDNAVLFIDHGADLHARDEDVCSTPLGWAAKFGQAATVELLLRRGAKPNLADDPPLARPLAWASRRGHGEIVELLKQYGAA